MVGIASGFTGLSHRIEGLRHESKQLLDASTVQQEWQSMVRENPGLAGQGSSIVTQQLLQLGIDPQKAGSLAQKIVSGKGVEDELAKNATRQANAMASWSMKIANMNENNKAIKASVELIKA